MEAITNVTFSNSGANGLGKSVLELQRVILTGHSPGVSLGSSLGGQKSPREA